LKSALIRGEKAMKTMTCKQLAGACDKELRANTFEEMSKMSQQHGMEMFQIGNEAHLKAMDEMKALMQEPDAMKAWLGKVRKECESLSED